MDQNNSNNGYNNSYQNYNNNEYQNTGYNNYGNYNNGHNGREKGGTNVALIILLVFLCFIMVGIIVLGALLLKDSKDSKDSKNEAVQVTQKVEKDSSKREIMYIASSDDEVDFLINPDNDEDNVMDTIPVGSKVVFLENENSTYAKIEYNSIEGYIERKYLTDNKPANLEKEEKPTPEPTVSPATPLPTPSSDVVTRYVYVSNVAYSIYLRSTPYETNNIICEIPVGTKVGYIGPANGVFSKIKYGSYVGYSKTQYLSSNYVAYEPPKNTYTQQKYMTVCNVAYSIYLRSTPYETNNIICEIPVGSTVEFIDGGNGTFYKIRWNGKVGYSKSIYLR